MKYFFSICISLVLFGCNKEPVDVPHVPFVYTDSIQDSEGNYYHTVTIGTQVWMAENLRSTVFQNGDTLALRSSSSDWDYSGLGGYCYYDNDSLAESIYGKLYNCRAVTDSRLIAPIGWHIPSQTEWQTLLDFVGSSPDAKLREFGAKHWLPPNENATDEFGFAALPGGSRTDVGTYEYVRSTAIFWSSTYYVPSDPNAPEGWYLGINKDSLELNHTFYEVGCSIRCIKD